jgi:hypothetical protein
MGEVFDARRTMSAVVPGGAAGFASFVSRKPWFVLLPSRKVPTI